MIRGKEYSFKEIKAILPYDYPFLFIDKAIFIETDKKIVCVKNVTGNEYYFAGHFKDNPILPGVILIEAMAQSAYLLGKLSAKNKNVEYFFAGINDFRFLKLVYPGDQVRMEIKVRTKIKKALLMKTEAFVGPVCVSKGELMIIER
jgi:3-hydroxyacyl-[acyl-carrier-protein] dehydratase